jgi:peptidyl-prolyl cis-trans isomerase B (cyclophilin B)
VPAASHRSAPRFFAHAALVGMSLLAISGCANSASSGTGVAGSATPTNATTATTQPADPQEGTLYTPTYKPNGTETAVITTNKGVIKVKLYGTDAPVNTANFIELAQKGFYDKVKFHRLEPGFVIQGGDPQTTKLTSKEVATLVKQQKQGVYEQGQPMLGTGGPGYTIMGEFDPANVKHAHVDGTLAMARSNDPNSAGSQFYFTLGPQSFLDGNYTVFGDVTEGLSVVHELEVGDVIESVTIENATK